MTRPQRTASGHGYWLIKLRRRPLRMNERSTMLGLLASKKTACSGIWRCAALKRAVAGCPLLSSGVAPAAWPRRLTPGADVPRRTARLHRTSLFALVAAQERFTEALLRDMAHVPLPLDRIFSQTVSGAPKSEVLAKLAARHPGAAYHFVEDKLSTLEKVATLTPCRHYLLMRKRACWSRTPSASRGRLHRRSPELCRCCTYTFCFRIGDASAALTADL